MDHLGAVVYYRGHSANLVRVPDDSHICREAANWPPLPRLSGVPRCPVYV
jgi:hypothetical protein